MIAEDGDTDNSSAPQREAKDLIIHWLCISWGSPQMRSCGCISLSLHYLSEALGTKENKKINSALIIHTEPVAFLKYICSTQGANPGLSEASSRLVLRLHHWRQLSLKRLPKTSWVCLRGSPVRRSFPSGVPVFFPSYYKAIGRSWTGSTLKLQASLLSIWPCNMIGWKLLPSDLL